MRPAVGWITVALLANLAPPSIGAEPPAGVSVELVRLDGRVQSGQLVQVTPELALQTTEGLLAIAWTDVLSIEPRDAAAGTPDTNVAPAPLLFVLADRSQFAGAVSAAEECAFTVALGGGRVVHVPLTAIQSIRVPAADPAAAGELDEALRALADSADRGGELLDVAVAARGERMAVLRGRIRSVGPEQALMDWNGREVALPWSRLAGLGFARPAPQSSSCSVHLHDGAILGGKITGGTAALVRLRSPFFEEELALPWTQIQRIDCRSERLVLLSDLKPARYEFEPFFDKHWAYGVDESLTGRPLELGGQRFVRGIAMHSRATLTYRLDGSFAQFAARAGVLDETAGRGCVTLRVLGDDRVLWEARGVRGAEPPREVLVDVRGVTDLTLEVDFDEDLDLADHAAFGFARLIR